MKINPANKDINFDFKFVNKPKKEVIIKIIPIDRVNLFMPKLGIRKNPVRSAENTLAIVDIAKMFPDIRPTSLILDVLSLIA